MEYCTAQEIIPLINRILYNLFPLGYSSVFEDYKNTYAIIIDKNDLTTLKLYFYFKKIKNSI